MSQFPELGVRGITVGWLKHALKRTNYFKSLDWSSAIKKPLLLLDATNDKLVNSSLNRELLGQSNLTTIVSLAGIPSSFILVQATGRGLSLSGLRAAPLDPKAKAPQVGTDILYKYDDPARQRVPKFLKL